MVLIYTKNASNLTNRYWDIVLDEQKMRTDNAKLYPTDIYLLTIILCQGRL